jgi:RNA polymerase sigma factor (sigma-70 family)
MLPNERELIVKSKEGDKQAFGVLYDHYIRRIYNYIFYKTFQKETAEDLTSQTFYKALRGIQSVDENKPFGAWLYTIAGNSVIDHYRSAKHNADIDDIWDVSDDTTDIEGDTDTQLRFGKVQKYLKQLAPSERDIIMMRVWQELSYKEIADIVGKSEASCKMVYSRAIKKLRDVIPATLLLLLLLKM